jgi:hypothetical protein
LRKRFSSSIDLHYQKSDSNNHKLLVYNNNYMLNQPPPLSREWGTGGGEAKNREVEKFTGGGEAKNREVEKFTGRGDAITLKEI